ncbi:pH-response regulator protein palH/RIM21 [Candida viswanathii]|uniref:pH-response regulator protein palH/RIM21 n=1 Tax=Candida viswanathii TaxID=5486 RepID=A0A367YIX1_9ASCO|nr:pH-response regulator protein palH/RIM21 [Candida viswanathii]
MYWKNTWWEGRVYPSCREIELPEGMIISKGMGGFPVTFISRAVYQQICYENSVPVMNTNVGFVMDDFAAPLPIISQSWYEYTRDSVRGSFAYSFASIIYAISVLAVIIWFLTIFVLTNYTIRPSWLLKTSTLLSTVYILVVVIKSIVILHGQQRDGYLHGAKLLDGINGYKAINIIDLIVVFLLQINQVQIIMRIFQRQKDKRMTFFVGVIASLTSQVIWGVSQFYNFERDSEAGDILPAFIYLVRIAMALCYAAIITVFFISKIQVIIANKKIWLLTLLTSILIYSPVAFFIADVSNAFVYELSEIFSVVNYVIGVVIPWEWCNKFNLIMKAKEKEGVLGRRFYEDELYELDRFELFVEEQTPDDEEGGAGGERSAEAHPNSDEEVRGDELEEQNRLIHTTQTTEEPCEKEELTASGKFKNALSFTKRTFLTITDNIIAAGFAIPRSVSVSTQSLTGKPKSTDPQQRHSMQEVVPEFNPEMFQERNDHTHETEASSVNNIASMSTSNNRRRNVYVYSRREVVLDLSSDD